MKSAKSETDSNRDEQAEEEQIKKLTDECAEKFYKLQTLENSLKTSNSGFCFAVLKTELSAKEIINYVNKNKTWYESV